MEDKVFKGRLGLSVIEMAEALGISRTKAYALVNRPGFPAKRIDGRILVSVEGLREWLNRGETDGKHSA